jgi:hypothetical protein
MGNSLFVVRYASPGFTPKPIARLKIAFPTITRLTEPLQIVDAVRAAARERYDVVWMARDVPQVRPAVGIAA